MLCLGVVRCIGIQYGDIVEPCGGRSMRYRTDLSGLALAIAKRSKRSVIILIAYLYAGIPEVACIRLIGYIFQHSGYLAIFNSIIQLPAKLEIIALMIYRIRAPAKNVNTLFNIFNHIVYTAFFGAGLQGNIWHSLKLNILPTVGMAAALAFRQAQYMRLVAGCLVAYQYPVFKNIPFLCFHPIIIIPNGIEEMRLRAVAKNIHYFTAELKISRFPFIEGGE